MHLKARTSFLLSDTENPLMVPQKLQSSIEGNFIIIYEHIQLEYYSDSPT